MSTIGRFEKLNYDLIIGIVVCLVLVKLTFNKYGRKLNAIPGPWLAGFTDLWRLIDTAFFTAHDTHIQLHRRTGSNFVRLGPRTVSVSDPDLIPTIYGLKSGFTKTKFYTLHMLPYDGEFTPSLFTTLDEDYHAKYKRPIANAYGMSTLVEFEPLIDSTTQLFMTRLDEFVRSDEVLDLGLWLQMYAFDVIGEIVFSKNLGFLETKSDVDGVIADIRTKVFLSGITPTHPVVKFTVARMQERALSKEKGGEETTKRDFLTRCYEAQAKNPELVTERIIRMYNIDNVLAGSDKTGISLRSVLYYLMKSPKCLQKVLDELQDTKLSEFVTWKESNQLVCLQACIREALRMHPAVGLLLERHVPSGGVELGGHFLPEGTIVGVNPWVAARKKSVFGEDADIFRPERWVEADAELLSKMERANLTFGHGSRSCIGKNISMLEISKLVPQLLWNYRFEFLTLDQTWDIHGGWFVGQDNFKVRVYRRDQQM